MSDIMMFGAFIKSYCDFREAIHNNERLLAHNDISHKHNCNNSEISKIKNDQLRQSCGFKNAKVFSKRNHRFIYFDACDRAYYLYWDQEIPNKHFDVPGSRY